MDDDALLYYSKQILLPQVGYSGQVKLNNARVAVIGLGGLGCSVALYLTLSGVGTLHLVDHDVVELSNLSRQILYTEENLSQLKVEAARDELLRHNPKIEVITYPSKITTANASSLLNTGQVDLVLDCTDNFATRYLINSACVQCKQVLISAAAIGFSGQLAGFSHSLNTGCYECLFPKNNSNEPNTRCRDQGVVSPLVGVMGSMQALEAMKVILGYKSSILGQLLVYEGLAQGWRQVALSWDQACAVCGAKEDDCV